ALLNGLALLYFLKYKIKEISIKKLLFSLFRQFPLWLSLLLYLLIMEYYLHAFLDSLGDSITELLNSELNARYRSMVHVAFGVTGGMILYLALARYMNLAEANVFFSVLERFKRKK
ncbi:MAG: hypothetical protein OEZ34_15540, partial [Spirochaetia bacterium]|nr:hypothetical protein [Spirochaetia bacterium]